MWFGLAGLVLAQEGHPLTGTWTGSWGPSAAQRSHLTFVMNWDGENVTGTINPGTDDIPIRNVSIDFAKWVVRIEAEAKDAAGKPVRIRAEGRLENLGSYHRTITGTWTQGASKGDFKLTRE